MHTQRQTHAHTQTERQTLALLYRDTYSDIPTHTHSPSQSFMIGIIFSPVALSRSPEYCVICGLGATFFRASLSSEHTHTLSQITHTLSDHRNTLVVLWLVSITSRDHGGKSWISSSQRKTPDGFTFMLSTF